MGCCTQTEHIVDEQTTTKVDTKTQYTLNAMRSLEGVARLWSKHIEQLESQNNNGYNAVNAVKPSLRTANSVPVNGNHNAISNNIPIAISTYFFLNSPRNQPIANLVQSHTSPNNRLIPIQQRSDDTKMDNVQKIVILENETLDLDECIHKETKTENENYTFPSPAFSISSPNLIATEAMPTLNIMPVFTTSLSNGFSELHTPQFCLTPLSLNDTDSNNFPDTCTVQSVQPMHTYSENNVFTLLSDMGLNQTDFMQYHTESLGFGASGVVTKAFHFSSCKMVAIKHCRSKQTEEILAFAKEAKLYKKFKDNKNIIDLIGFGKDQKNNASMMALEFLDLNSTHSLKLSENITDIKQRELIVGHIAFNVLLALEDLHKFGFCHNDIKPENILVNKAGDVKLSDFGTMLELENGHEFLYKNVGTQRFQSPEKTSLNPTKYNTKSDIWSLGITCFELLCGERDIDEISYTMNPPILKADKHNLSENCCDFINQCLCINQFERPAAKQLLTHLWLSDIETVGLNAKWPWLCNIEYNNEDLLFMISALILYYSTKKFNDKNSGSIQRLHRRVSIKHKHKNGGEMFSDEQRIANIAKYACCDKDYVIDRIKVTVSYIKSQLNKTQ